MDLKCLISRLILGWFWLVWKSNIIPSQPPKLNSFLYCSSLLTFIYPKEFTALKLKNNDIYVVIKSKLFESLIVEVFDPRISLDDISKGRVLYLLDDWVRIGVLVPVLITVSNIFELECVQFDTKLSEYWSRLRFLTDNRQPKI